MAQHGGRVQGGVDGVAQEDGGERGWGRRRRRRRRRRRVDGGGRPRHQGQHRLQLGVQVDGRAGQEEGRVQLAITVAADGTCKDAQVVTSSGKTRLDEASVNLCKRKFRWTPATQAGNPIEAKVNMNVTWQLK